jgi:predicted GNAT superfamily acetyltransferase
VTVLREVLRSDIPRLVQLNDEAVPAVPPTTEAEFESLLAHADHAFGVVERDASEGGSAGDAPLAGFVLAMHPGGDYASENYRWFEARGTDGLYVDRIVVAGPSRGSGLGRVLYDHAFGLAVAAGRREVTCEVNIEPPNPGSLRFHARLGFTEVGRQATKGGSVVVALLAAPVVSVGSVGSV